MEAGNERREGGRSGWSERGRTVEEGRDGGMKGSGLEEMTDR